MDIAVAVITAGTAPDGGYEAGDVVMAYEADTLGALDGRAYAPHEVIASPRLSFMFVTGCPDVSISAVNRVLGQGLEESRRAWRLTDLSAFTNGHATMGFEAFEAICRNKTDESRTITEAIG